MDQTEIFTPPAPQSPDYVIDTVVLENKPYPGKAGGGFGPGGAKNYGAIVYSAYREEVYGEAMYVWLEKRYPDQRQPVKISLGTLDSAHGKPDYVGEPFVSGNDIYVPLFEHLMGEPYRVSLRGFKIARGFAEGDNPGAHEDAPGVNLGQNQGDSGMTLDELVAATSNGDSPWHHALKNAIKDFVQQVLVEQGVLRVGSPDAEKYAILAQEVRDRDYEAEISYFGPPKPPGEPAAPTGEEVVTPEAPQGSEQPKAA